MLGNRERPFLRTDALPRGPQVARGPGVAVGAPARRLSRNRDQEPRPRASRVAQWKGLQRTIPDHHASPGPPSGRDGEIVAVNEDGLPSFNLLQNFGSADHTILFYAFDLLILARTDLRSRTRAVGVAHSSRLQRLCHCSAEERFAPRTPFQCRITVGGVVSNRSLR
jgi:hypothetical protein